VGAPVGCGHQGFWEEFEELPLVPNSDSHLLGLGQGPKGISSREVGWTFLGSQLKPMSPSMLQQVSSYPSRRDSSWRTGSRVTTRIFFLRTIGMLKC
jgi:hypothetical protein